jgi:hypothetical protein
MSTLEQDTLKIKLTSDEAINPELLVAPSKRDFGTEPEIVKRNIEIRIGARPRALDLRRVYGQNGKEFPKDVELYTSYRVWLISHHVSILRHPGIEYVNRFSFEARFGEKPRVTILGLFPETKFVTRAAVDASAKAVAGIDLKGAASAPTVDLSKLSPIVLSAGGSAQFELGTKVGFVGNLTLSVMTPAVVAVGVGDIYSHWAFEKVDQPLVGDQTISQTVLVPKNKTRLDFEVRVGATISTFDLLPSRRTSEWMRMSVELPREE